MRRSGKRRCNDPATKETPCFVEQLWRSFWCSDDHGFSWHFVAGPEGLGGPTMLGGGDSDIATGYGSEVYSTGLTVADITLASSCADGADSTWAFNPISVLSSPDDRQWLD